MAVCCAIWVMGGGCQHPMPVQDNLNFISDIGQSRTKSDKLDYKITRIPCLNIAVCEVQIDLLHSSIIICHALLFTISFVLINGVFVCSRANLLSTDTDNMDKIWINSDQTNKSRA